MSRWLSRLSLVALTLFSPPLLPNAPPRTRSRGCYLYSDGTMAEETLAPLYRGLLRQLR